MMTIQEMNLIKQANGLSNQLIASESGLPVVTVQRVLSGSTRFPRAETLRALDQALNRLSSSSSPLVAATGFRESAVHYGAQKQGQYTLQDYYALPEDHRAELIDGVLYSMAAPSLLHQQLLIQLIPQFKACADTHGKGCEVFSAPCDVRLDQDDLTILQPDLFVICRDYDRKAKAIEGAPDLTLEILSPSTRARDMILKLGKYYNAGVREYWIVDPENRQVYVYDFSLPNFRQENYSFDDQIPIRLSDGKCWIDFAAIHRSIASFY